MTKNDVICIIHVQMNGQSLNKTNILIYTICNHSSSFVERKTDYYTIDKPDKVTGKRTSTQFLLD